MKHYKDTNGKIYAYAADGSDDHIIPSDFILLSDAEAKKLIAELQQKINAENQKKYNEKSPVEKLTDFLRSNPEVAELLNK